MKTFKKYFPLVLVFIVASVIAYRLIFKINNMKLPVSGRITSKYGNRTHPVTGATSFHNGIDIAVPVGTPVYAPASGIVKTVYSNSTGGIQMIVDHDNGFRTGYAHLSETIARPGQRVKQGEIIAKTGNTGASTGPHLHLTLRKNGTLVNPEEYLI